MDLEAWDQYVTRTHSVPCDDPILTEELTSILEAGDHAGQASPSDGNETL